VSAGIDRLLTLARRHEPGSAEKLLRETADTAASTAGWHAWLWELRLSQARAELALARGDFDLAIREATDGIDQSRTKRRPKYEALGLITRAHALHSLGRTYDAIVDARLAVSVARRTGDPASLLLALDAVLSLDGDDESAAEAPRVRDRILMALPDEQTKRGFSESEVVRRLARLS
jgi:hypothetical protein